METKPFHEAVVDAIKSCKSKKELITIGKLLFTTKIPQNHENIRKTLKSKAKNLNVPNRILDEKLLAEEEECNEIHDG